MRVTTGKNVLRLERSLCERTIEDGEILFKTVDVETFMPTNIPRRNRNSTNGLNDRAHSIDQVY